MNTKADLNSLGLLMLRLWVGTGMAYHGYGKFEHMDRFVQGVQNMGFPMPTVFAWAAFLSELVGGVMIAIGFKTRPAAFFVTVTMAVAFFIRHANDPFKVKELALCYGVGALVLAIMGAGAYSMECLCPCSKKGK